MLKKILEEIEEEKLKHWDPSERLDTDKLIGWCFEKCKNIIRKHMSIGKDINVHTNNNWIPVEERLPEESGYYRVTVKNTELGDITEETAWFAHVDDYDMDESEWRELYEYEEVIAWRELSSYSPEELERSEGE